MEERWEWYKTLVLTCCFLFFWGYVLYLSVLKEFDPTLSCFMKIWKNPFLMCCCWSIWSFSSCLVVHNSVRSKKKFLKHIFLRIYSFESSMKLKVGQQFLRIKKLRLRTCLMPLIFPKLIFHLLNCIRSKISFFELNSSHTKIQTSDHPLMHVISQGLVAINVGEDQQHYMVPIPFLSHPFIMKLLMEAEKEFGYHNRGPITFPYTTNDFEKILWLIDKVKSSSLLHIHILYIF